MDSVRDVHPGRVVAILLVYAASILLLGIRWHALVRMAGGTPHWTSSAEVFLTSVIVNYAAPIGLAVPTRAALTVRDLELSPGQSGAVVGWEAALDVVALSRHLRRVARSWWIGSRADDECRRSGPRAPGGCRGPWCCCDAAPPADRRRSALESLRLPVACFPARPSTRCWRSLPLRSPVGSGASSLAIMAALLQLFGVAVSLSLLLGIMGVPVLVGMLSPVPGGAGCQRGIDGGGGSAGGSCRGTSRAGGGCLSTGALSGNAPGLGSGPAGASGRRSSLMFVIPDTFRQRT